MFLSLHKHRIQTARTNHQLCVCLLPCGNPNSTMSQRWILPRIRRMRRICPTQGVSWDCAQDNLECPWQKDPKRALPTTEEHVDPHIDRREKKASIVHVAVLHINYFVVLPSFKWFLWCFLVLIVQECSPHVLSSLCLNQTQRSQNLQDLPCYDSAAPADRI